MIFGGRDIVHKANENSMRATVRSICQQIVDRASRKLAESSTGQWVSHDGALDAITCYALECVRVLWLEEQEVATAVIESIDRDEEF